MDYNEYEFETNKVIDKINSNNYKKILLQLPDGLKEFANKIQNKIKLETTCEIFIWAGSNFGACDIPLEVEKIGFDLIVHFGHSSWIQNY